jgi:hypothetical protein
VVPRAGLDDVEKRKFLTLTGLELRPARNQSLYRLHYPDSVNLGTFPVFPRGSCLSENPGCNAMYSVQSQVTCRRKTSPPSSALQGEPSKKSAFLA